MQNVCALILAAGKGTRMSGAKPKVLQKLLGEPMLFYVHEALYPCFADRIWAVVGYEAQMIYKAFENSSLKFVMQEQQLGTAHALMQAMPVLQDEKSTHVLVVNGDTPLLSSHIIESFLKEVQGVQVGFATLMLSDPLAYGRVVRKDGHIMAIVESKDYDEQKHGGQGNGGNGGNRGNEGNEVNAGLYYFEIKLLEDLLGKIDTKNKSGEYYLTDLISLAVEKNYNVKGIECGQNSDLLGVNTAMELAYAESILNKQIIDKHMQSGVIMHMPQTICIGTKVIIENGVEIYGPTEIYGCSHIKSGAVIYSNCVIKDAVIGENTQIHSFSHIDNANIAENCSIGPYARLRPHAHLADNVKIGNFVEIKKSDISSGAKVSHLSYIGDSQIGAGVNIGAGTITCNYDGKNKFITEIGENSFIGSNTALVAPVSIGKNVLVGAGSVITENIADNEMAIGRAKQVNMRKR